MSIHTPSGALAEIAERTDPVLPQAPHRVLYDRECEIYQGCVAWLKSEASCFPWGRRTSWETCGTDERIRLLSLGHFSHTELVRSFVRTDSDVLSTANELRVSAEENPHHR